MKKNNKGFTLIELLVTVAIVAILSTLGYSTYQNKMKEARRTDAKTKLMEIMQKEERYFNENNTYTITFSQMSYTVPLYSDNQYYVVTGAANANGLLDGLILTATPQGVQATDTCGTFILNSNGQKSIGGTDNYCW